MNSYRISHPSGLAVLQNPRRLIRNWWHGLPTELRSTKWPVIFMCLAIVALLMGFHQVVQSAVKQGELLRMSTATRAQAVWRCQSLQGERMRASCMRQLDAPPVTVAEPSPLNGLAPHNTAALQVAQR